MNRIMAFLLASALLVFTNAVALAQSTDAAAETGTVVFYRSSEDGGKAYSLTHQNKELAKLKKGERFEQKLSPGTYYYMADPSSEQVFTLEIKAGETYYVNAARDGSFFNGSPSLKVTSVQDYQQAIAKN